MGKKRFIQVLILTVFAMAASGVIFFAGPANEISAAAGDKVNVKMTNPIKANSIEEIINNVIDFFFTIALIVCPLIIIAGGFLMVTSGGDPGKTETGKKMVYYALIGLGIVILAKGFVLALKQILNVKKTTALPLLPLVGMLMPGIGQAKRSRKFK